MLPSRYEGPNGTFVVRNSVHSAALAYCWLASLQKVCAVVQMLPARAWVRMVTACVADVAPNLGAACSIRYSTAHGHHLKMTSYCEISFFEFQVIQVSITMGTTTWRDVMLNINLLVYQQGFILSFFFSPGGHSTV